MADVRRYWASAVLRKPEAALERLRHSVRLSPSDPHSFTMYGAMAGAHFFAGRYTESLLWAERSLREMPNYLPAAIVAAASNALAGRPAEAQRAMARVRQLDPPLRI